MKNVNLIFKIRIFNKKNAKYVIIKSEVDIMSEFKRIMPQKDGLYALKLSHLGYITTPGTERFYKEDNNAETLLTGEEIADVYTLVKYKGNGLFEEHYSGENALLCVSIYDTESTQSNGLFKNFADDNILAFKNEQEKKAKLKFFKKTPFVVDAMDLIEITPEIISMINKNNIGDSVRTYIADLKEFCEKEFEQYETEIKSQRK